MARPAAVGLDWFRHDTDASTDEKIEALRLLYGNDGYAFYFILLERIYRTPEIELDVSDAETIQILAGKIRVPVERFEMMLQTALRHGCFDAEAYTSRRVLTSAGAKQRASATLEKREKMRKGYEEKADKVSAAETPQKRGISSAQSRVEKSREENTIPPLPPTGGSDGDSSPEPEKKDRRRSRVRVSPAEVAEQIEYPAELDTPEFREEYGKWIAHRMKLRKPGAPWPEFFNTQLADIVLPMGCADGLAAVKHSRVQGWQGIHPDKGANEKQQPVRNGIQGLLR